MVGLIALGTGLHDRAPVRLPSPKCSRTRLAFRLFCYILQIHSLFETRASGPMVDRLSLLCGLLAGVLLVAGSVPCAHAQTTLRGTVLDAETGAPLSGVHVFIAQSMVGTTTDDAGRFVLRDLRAGSAQLVVSRVGYTGETRTLLLTDDDSRTFRFALTPTVIEAEEVTVTAERDAEWYERLETFTRLFIGDSPIAARCSLQNPEVLRFDTSWWGAFTATAAEPLVIENRALGYRVTYHLKEFEKNGTVVRWDGEPLFEPLTPRDSAEARRWATHRRQAYEGSLRHFLAALVRDRVEAEQFEMRWIPRAGIYRSVQRADRHPISRDRILTADSDSTWELSFSGRLEVTYHGAPEHEDYLRWAKQRHERRPRPFQRSQIDLDDPPVHIDAYGEIVEPYGATVYNYFSYELRLSGLLPREYTAESDTSPLSKVTGER